MARRVNKSEAVRKALQEYPEKSLKWITEYLLGKKIEVTPQLVSMVKNRLTAPVKSDREVEEAIDFVIGNGGVEKIQRMLAIFEKVQEQLEKPICERS